MRLLMSIPFVFAWYGFAAEGLMQRVAPLIAGLAIGLLTELPFQLAPPIGQSHWRLVQRYMATGDLLNLAYSAAVAVTLMWLIQRPRGSLLPAVLFVASVKVASDVAFWWGYEHRGGQPGR